LKLAVDLLILTVSLFRLFLFHPSIKKIRIFEQWMGG
jgi:hypothetical protein